MAKRSEKVRLRPVELTDAQFLFDLINDEEVRDCLGAYNLVLPVALEAEEKWIADSRKKGDERHQVIEKRDDGRPIGIISIKEIDGRNSSAHLSVIIERRSWDRGYGTEAVTKLLTVLFMRENYHRVWLRVAKRNVRAIRCYEKCGFRKEGTLRGDHFFRGQWESSHIMSILAEEFRRRRA